MQIELTIDGDVQELDIDLDLDSFRLQESVRLEDALPAAQFAAIMNGEVVDPTPRMLQAMIWAKLATRFPDIGLNDFDLDLTELLEVAKEQPGDVVIPMTMPDGEVVEGQAAVSGKG